MTAPVGTEIPAAGLVTRWWLLTLPELSGVQIGQTLLTPYSSWAADRFITVTDVVPYTDAYTPLRSHRIQVDAWGRPAPAAQTNVPYNQCVSLLERVADVARDFRPVRIPIKDVYIAIDVKDVMVVNDPYRVIEKTPQGNVVAIGRAMMELQITYMPVYE